MCAVLPVAVCVSAGVRCQGPTLREVQEADLALMRAREQ